MISTKFLTRVAVLAGCASLLAGCGVSNLVNHAKPDEFAVQRQAPLVTPPDFALTPPQPGALRPSAHTGQDATLEARFGGPAARSNVENAAVNKAGAADPSIRSTVADPKTSTADKGDVTRDIIAAPQGDGREAQTQAKTTN